MQDGIGKGEEMRRDRVVRSIRGDGNSRWTRGVEVLLYSLPGAGKRGRCLARWA